MPGQQGLARQRDGTFTVTCKICTSDTFPTVVATGLPDREAAEQEITKHRLDVHKFGGVVTGATV